MSQSAEKYYSLEEYFALEEKSDRKSEYFQGEIFMMSSGSANHSRICTIAVVELSLALRGSGCEVFNSDMRILVQDGDLYTYPDASVVCGEVEFVPGRNDTLTNPILLIEVLSPSTRSYDRADKFRFYRSIESLQIYLIIEQDEPFVERHQRLPDGSWTLRDYSKLDEVIELAPIGVNLTVGQLYERVKFPDKRPKRHRIKIVPHPDPREIDSLFSLKIRLQP